MQQLCLDTTEKAVGVVDIDASVDANHAVDVGQFLLILVRDPSTFRPDVQLMSREVGPDVDAGQHLVTNVAGGMARARYAVLRQRGPESHLGKNQVVADTNAVGLECRA